jgi:NAD(P)-dependent dehydrogenase (short-subunit alcohol dehydrogenase family)
MRAGQLRDRVAIVTGGAGAIGRAICRRFDEEGAIVYVADVREDAAVETADRLRAGRPLLLDVTSSASWDDGLRSVASEHGQLDILVNNAATHVQALVEDMPDAEWDRVIRTNAYSVFYGCRAAIPALRKSSAPSIVNIVTGQFGVAYSSAYTSSKFLVYGFSQCRVLEVSRYGIRVNCIAPGAIPSTGFERWYREKAQLLEVDYEEFLRGALESIPLRRFGQPEEIAEAALYLVSDRASYVTGHLLDVGGGFSGYAFALPQEDA